MTISYEDLRRIAAMAPSILNTKPWSLSKVAEDRYELRADWGRSLEVIDPRHRELIISCGAALLNVRMAIRVTGHDLAYSLVPSEQPEDDECQHCKARGRRTPGLLASVEISLRWIHPATEDEQRLYEMIPLRHTVRKPFNRKIDMNKAVELEMAARTEGVDAMVVHDREVRRLLREAAEASRELAGDQGHGDELREWTGRGARVTEDYGVPQRELARQPKGRHRPPPVRDLGLAWGKAGERGNEDYEKCPHLIKLTAETDTPPDLMRMGQALQRLLLTATRYGVQASLLTQRSEVDDWKKAYKRTNPWWPSPRPWMAVRFGYASDPADPARDAGGTR